MGEIRRGGHRIGEHGWEPASKATAQLPEVKKAPAAKKAPSAKANALTPAVKAAKQTKAKPRASKAPGAKKSGAVGRRKR